MGDDSKEIGISKPGSRGPSSFVRIAGAPGFARDTARVIAHAGEIIRPGTDPYAHHA
jgi:hypothetical protein